MTEEAVARLRAKTQDAELHQVTSIILSKEDGRALLDVLAPEGVEGVSTIHWFPHDLVEWRHDDAYGAKVSDYGVVSGSERTLGMTTLWVYVPGHSKPRQWPAAQCRLLRRNNPNKEGQ